MKKVTLITILFFITTLAMAHIAVRDTTKKVKPKTADTVKKEVAKPAPGYILDGNKTVPFTVTLTFSVKAGTINDYIYIQSHGGMQAIEDGDLRGEVRKSLKNTYYIIQNMFAGVPDSLSSRMYKAYADFLKKDVAKFKADSLKAANSKKH